MIIIKIGGSIFAPKQSEIFNIELLNKISLLISDNYKGQVVLVHGTGNIGHDFVNKYGITRDTFEIFKALRKPFYEKMDSIFSGYTRLSAECIIKNKDTISSNYKNFIIGGDIDSETLDIISSDVVFGKIIGERQNANGIIITDVPGVLDDFGNIIKTIELGLANKIKFWKKSGDVTDSMQGKLLALSGCLTKGGKGVWIVDGNNLDNIKSIINSGKGEGTYVIK